MILFQYLFASEFNLSVSTYYFFSTRKIFNPQKTNDLMNLYDSFDS